MRIHGYQTYYRYIDEYGHRNSFGIVCKVQIPEGYCEYRAILLATKDEIFVGNSMIVDCILLTSANFEF